jgi:hypothetical protein
MHSDGFRWNPNGVIEYMFVYPQPPTLKVGDQLVRVGLVEWDDFHADLKKTFFNDAKASFKNKLNTFMRHVA